MKPKKNPKRDLNKNSGLYFVIGLVLVMVLTYVAFEWKTYDQNAYDYTGMNTPDEIPEVSPPVIPINTLPPPPVPVAAPSIEIRENDEDIIETEILSTDTNQTEEVIKVEDVIFDKLTEVEPIPFSVIEDVPVFPGCENEQDKRACFQEMMNKHIAKNFRYPEIAQEMGIQGKVYIQFIIQKDGSIGNIQKRGPDKHLEAEATRIINMLPQMKPGKQRGTPVKVPFSIPINFKLQ